jgi:RNA polymerase sigma factor (TIGR02999 family)
VPVPEATRTLVGSLAGDPDAKRRLMELVYEDLRELAAAHLARERGGHTLQPTALVHEAYLRLIGQERADIESRTHFLAVAALSMRRVLVDHARARRSEKRGGGREREGSAFEPATPWEDPSQLLDLDQALEGLARAHPRQAQVVELHVFGGLVLEDVGAALGLSRESAKLDWRFARAWLLRELGGSSAGAVPHWAPEEIA